LGCAHQVSRSSSGRDARHWTRGFRGTTFARARQRRSTLNMRYLLDTNIVSEPVTPIPNRRVLTKLKKYEHELSTAAPVWHELVFGYERLPQSKKRTAIGEYLHQVVRASIPILPYDEVAATWHAEERNRLSAAGRSPSFIDGQIAAVAHANRLTLVTRNVRDFAGFRGLKVENWFDE
jgi:tRNA(fMet)-specific endonuclease VapC